MKKTLTPKEQLFCSYYSLRRNGREAAVKAGYRLPERSAAKLLEKKAVLDEIERLDKKKAITDRAIAAGYYRLAFGCVSDAVNLMFTDNPLSEDVENMDLFNIADIKKAKGGGVEIKFFDRLKALEKLEQLSAQHVGAESNPFYEAIEKGAAALNAADKLG